VVQINDAPENVIINKFNLNHMRKIFLFNIILSGSFLSQALNPIVHEFVSKD